ncbi:uncharacterized protein LOC142324985 isoform X5 [Lycorma delicatula]|uniref:uncharacterized protein LOC142324985 isoform X5 n=1 Tax=Lycorma delicatula TaxID=130591 RepID=UPI003F510C25
MKKMVARKLLLVACAAVYSTGANIPENNEIMPQKNNNELIDNSWLVLHLNTDGEIRWKRSLDNEDVMKSEDAKLIKQKRVNALKRVLFDTQYVRRRRNRARNRRDVNANLINQEGPPPPPFPPQSSPPVNEQKKDCDKEPGGKGLKNYICNIWNIITNQFKSWFRR